MKNLYNSNLVLENAAIRLEPFNLVNAKFLRDIACDEKIWAFMLTKVTTEEEFNQYVKDTLKDKVQKNIYPFIVFDKRANRYVGSTSYGFLDYDNKSLMIGWTWYGTDFQGKGVNKNCKYLLLKHAFENFDCRRVTFSTENSNRRSQYAIGKIGATREGVSRNLIFRNDGVSTDWVIYSIIQQEWEEIKTTIFRKLNQNKSFDLI